MFSLWSGGSHQTGLSDHHFQLPHLGLLPISPHSLQHPNIHAAMVKAKEDLAVAEVATTEDKFFVKLDTRGYTRDELEVKTLDGYLIIQGQAEESGAEEFKTSRGFSRRFLLPGNCRVNELRCELGGTDNDDKMLRVTIPRDGKGKSHSISLPHKAPSNLTPNYTPYHGHGHWVSGVDCNKDQFVVRLDLPRFSPDEVTVKTVDDYLFVEGSHGEREEEGVKGVAGILSSSSFKRRYLIPLNADRDGMTCEFRKDGRLKVTVPRINVGKTNVEKLHKVVSV